LQKLAEDWKPYDGPAVELSVWMYALDPDSLKAYKKAFEKKYSNIKLKYVTYPEENYVTKVNVALQAHNPPDIAVMEEAAWMKAHLTADLAREVAQPNSDPTRRVYGASAPDWGFGIWQKWVFGPDGRKILGNLNTEPEIEAWNLGTALVRDKLAPSGKVTSTVAEPERSTGG